MDRMYSIPAKEWKKLIDVIDLNKWINEDQAAELLGIKKTTLQNKIYKKEIPVQAMSIGVGGARFFDREYLIGLKKPNI
jgi:hypothetical protein